MGEDGYFYIWTFVSRQLLLEFLIGHVTGGG